MANGWFEIAAYGSAVDLAEGPDDVGGSFGRGIPALQEMGRALVTVPDSWRGEKEKEGDKMGDEELP